jgi:hypothetical protein
MQTPYEQLRAVINNLFPERLGLSNGCEIKDGDKIAVIFKLSREKYYREYFEDGEELVISREMLLYNKCIEILGQPLTLADVLVALKNKETGIDDDGNERECFWCADGCGLN